jgi:ADP-ribosyl-[dinitrogen reductase] hydrolase
MRLAPVALFYYPDAAAAEHYAGESSRTTHGAAECVDACRLLARLLIRALEGASREEILTGDAEVFTGAEAIVRISRGIYRTKSESHIRGSGYVVDSLEAALWCLDRSDSFETAVLAAANLGDDSDTTAAVCGQLAGAHFGATGIPPRWLSALTMGPEIESLADQLHDRP